MSELVQAGTSAKEYVISLISCNVTGKFIAGSVIRQVRGSSLAASEGRKVEKTRPAHNALASGSIWQSFSRFTFYLKDTRCLHQSEEFFTAAYQIEDA